MQVIRVMFLNPVPKPEGGITESLLWEPKDRVTIEVRGFWVSFKGDGYVCKVPYSNIRYMIMREDPPDVKVGKRNRGRPRKEDPRRTS